MRRVLWCSFVALALAALPALAEHPACQPEEPVRSRLESLDPDLSGCGRGEPCRAEALEELKALLNERGFDLHLWSNRVHFELRDKVRTGDEVVAELEALAKIRNSADAWYLAGAAHRLDVEKLKKALELDPRHPWAHLILASRIWDNEEEEALRSFEIFLEECPSRARDLFLYTRQEQTTEVFRRHLSALGEATKTLPAVERVATLPKLWAIQFHALPPEEHDAVREEVAREVASVRGLELWDHPLWWKALEDGYALVGNEAALAGLGDERLERFPCGKDSMPLRIERLVKRFDPNVDDMRLKAKALDFTDEQVPEVIADFDALAAECPGNQAVMGWRFRLLEKDESASAERVQKLAEEYLASQKQGGGVVRLGSPEVTVAKLYVERGIAFERVLELVEASRENPPDYASLRMPESFRERLVNSRKRTEVDLARYAGVAHLALGNRGAAKQEIERAGELYSALDPEKHAQGLPGLFEELAPLREKLGLAALSAPEPLPTEGTEPQDPWETVERELPAFSLTDLSGKVWTAKDFEGRGVLINFWATWCLPCIAEMPEVEALHASVAERDDLLVVTFNVDHEVGKVQPFVSKRGYAVPVIMAQGFLAEGERSLPQNWVVDRNGVVRKKSTGFAVDGAETWKEDALRVLREVAGEE